MVAALYLVFWLMAWGCARGRGGGAHPANGRIVFGAGRRANDVAQRLRHRWRTVGAERAEFWDLRGGLARLRSIAMANAGPVSVRVAVIFDTDRACTLWNGARHRNVALRGCGWGACTGPHTLFTVRHRRAVRAGSAACFRIRSRGRTLAQALVSRGRPFIGDSRRGRAGARRGGGRVLATS